jgi:hypothetical protein
MALKPYGFCGIITSVAWEIEYTDEFGSWWDNLSADEQDSINFGVRLLQERGPNLKRPFADTIAGSVYPNMKELRCQHEGRPYRVLFAFDPRRSGILLIGGDKTGKPNWYEENVPRAGAIYAQHLKEIENDLLAGE